MPGWCMGRAATQIHARVRLCSPTQHRKKTTSFVSSEEKTKLSHEVNGFTSNNHISESNSGNRVMVVVDSSLESRGALEWALSHTVQIQDTIILLHVSKKGNGVLLSDEKTNEEVDLLRSTKNMCQLKRPGVHVELAVQEGKEKGAIIVEEAKRLRVSLLVLGHKNQTFRRRIQMIWRSKRTRNRVVDYCIQNANCMTVAVRRKSKKYGGYLITTKRHKKFWLLA